MVIIGLGTFLIRASFWLFKRPAWLDACRPFLSRLPAVVLPILAASFFVGGKANPSHFAGGLVAALIMWRTKSVMAAMGFGFLVFWLLKTFVPLGAL